jgi:hypothetical protein
MELQEQAGREAFELWLRDKIVKEEVKVRVSEIAKISNSAMYTWRISFQLTDADPSESPQTGDLTRAIDLGEVSR